MNNIIDDQTIVAQALIGRTQEQLDAYERLMKYAMTLEVQVGCYEAFVEEISWEGTIGVFDQAAVDALREDLTVAQQGVDDNYGLLEKTDHETVEDYVEQYVAGESVDIELEGGETQLDVDVTPTSSVNEEIKDRLERL